MPILDSILPETLHPMVKHAINVLVVFHIIAFLAFVVLLVKSFMKGPSDHFKD